MAGWVKRRYRGGCENRYAEETDKMIKKLTALYIVKCGYFFVLLKVSKHRRLLIVTRLKVRSILRQFMKNMTIRADIRKMNKAIRLVFIV